MAAVAGQLTTTTPLTLAPEGKANVVIIGAGFGGLQAAKILANVRDVHVTLVDRRNHHLFQPLLYQVATAGLEPADIAVPIRAQFRRAPNIEVHLADVERIDPASSVIASADHTVRFDYLIVATGSHHSYFGHPEWEPLSPGLKSLEQATEIRRRLLDAFERAENELDADLRRAYMTFIVVGAGPTGVELAGAIADIRRTVLSREFRRIDPTTARVLLLEGGPRILAGFDADLAARAARDLRNLGVEVLVNHRVEDIDSDGVVVAGRRIPSRTVVWAAGVQASHLGAQLGAPLDQAGRVLVEPDLSIPGHPNIFVIGDLAHFELPNHELAPGLAPVAMQQGRTAARNILADLRDRPRKPFHYRDKGMLATIGKHRAIVQTRFLHLGGYLAWVAWLLVHIFFLVGFRNRIAVFLNWIWSYLFSKRGARIITTSECRTET